MPEQRQGHDSTEVLFCAQHFMQRRNARLSRKLGKTTAVVLEDGSHRRLQFVFPVTNPRYVAWTNVTFMAALVTIIIAPVRCAWLVWLVRVAPSCAFFCENLLCRQLWPQSQPCFATGWPSRYISMTLLCSGLSSRLGARSLSTLASPPLSGMSNFTFSRACAYAAGSPAPVELLATAVPRGATSQLPF